MKRLLSLLALALAVTAAWADDTFVFVDANGVIVPDGSTVVITNGIEDMDPETGESYLLYDSGLSVRNTTAQSAALAINYMVSALDNGIFQICFPVNCTMRETTGMYNTSAGPMGANQTKPLNVEWVSLGPGKCIVTLQIDVQRASSSFPPTYTHLAFGPKITVVFDPDAQPSLPGDVNGDGIVSGADVTALYGVLLDGKAVDGKADVNGDTIVSGADVTALYTILLSE